MASWTQLVETTWVLVDSDGGYLAAVTEHGPFFGDTGVVYRTSGQLIDQVMDFATLEEAQRAVEALAEASES